MNHIKNTKTCTSRVKFQQLIIKMGNLINSEREAQRAAEREAEREAEKLKINDFYHNHLVSKSSKKVANEKAQVNNLLGSLKGNKR